MKTVNSRLRNSNIHNIFNLKDDMGKGRLSMLASSVIAQAMLPLTSGVFYTGFLIANDINIVNANIIEFIPQIAGLFCILSPYILERLQKRKTFLIITRLAYYVLSILGITILPLIVQDTRMKTIGFSLIFFAASSLSSLTAPGFTPWHLYYIPDNVRVDYFGYSQIIRSATYSAVFLLSGYFADSLKGSVNESSVLYGLRIIAFMMAIAELIFLALPAEPSYEKSEPPKLKNIFTLSLGHKKFLRIIKVMAAWSFFFSCSASSVNYFLLNTAKVPYSYIGFLDALYPLFLFAFSAYWRQYIKSHTWLRAFAFNALLYTPSLLLLAFVTNENYTVLLAAVTVCQHFSGVGLNLSYANLPFINMPEEDRTNYTAFFILCLTVAIALGTLFGTLFIAATQYISIYISGIPFSSPQFLLIIQFAGQTLTAAYILLFTKRIEPAKSKLTLNAFLTGKR